MIQLAFRHLRRHWRLNAAMLLLMTLASAVVAGLSSRGTAIATRDLQRALADARPAERTLLITGTPYTFSDELYQQLEQKLGKFLRERLVIRHITLPADPPPEGEAGSGQRAVTTLEAYAFDEMPDHVRLVEGSLPTHLRFAEAIGYWPPPVEAVIGARAAEASGYGIGDRLSASGLYHRFVIVGIVEPIDPADDIWGGDLGAFAPPTEAGETLALPLIIASTSMKSYLGAPIFPHDIAWRITLNRNLITAERAEALRSALINFETQSATRQARTSSGLVQILTDTLDELSRVRTPLLLFTIVSPLLALYALTLFTSFIVDRSQGELVTLSGQGANQWQISQVFALEAAYLAVPAALLLGPALALCATFLWTWMHGESMAAAFPLQAWLLSGLVVGLGWLAWVLPVWWLARRGEQGKQPLRSRPPQRSVIQKRYLDLYLLAFGLLLVWQLNRSSSFVMRRIGDTPLADPLLLVGPSVLVVAVAMVSLRLLPSLFRLAGRLLRSFNGLVLPLGLARLARDPLGPGRLVLLVSLTAALALFTRCFDDSLARSQQMMIAYNDISTSLAQDLASTFQLNVLLLALFSVCAFFLVHLFAAQDRARELGVLRAMGLSVGQGAALLIVEGILVLGLGLLVGAGLGLVLSYLMIPYLLQALGGSLAEATAAQIVIDGAAMVRLVAVLFLAYGATLALLVVPVRTLMRSALWREDE